MTYFKSEDALRAIHAVNNIFIDGRTLKASLGTTKYCSHFMKNQSCPKHDCMYLHELGKLIFGHPVTSFLFWYASLFLLCVIYLVSFHTNCMISEYVFKRNCFRVVTFSELTLNEFICDHFLLPRRSFGEFH